MFTATMQKSEYVLWWRLRIHRFDTGFDRTRIYKPLKRFRYSDKIRQQKKSSKGRRPDSFNRERKLKEFRNNDKTPSAWPISNSAKRWAQIEDNRKNRREARALIRQGRFDEVKTQQDPVDKWKWD